jgi:superfamily II DNA helicase RecQ
MYCSSRFECKSLSFHLVECCFTAAPYHAGFSDVEREYSQENWMAGLCQVLFFLWIVMFIFFLILNF